MINECMNTDCKYHSKRFKTNCSKHKNCHECKKWLKSVHGIGQYCIEIKYKSQQMMPDSIYGMLDRAKRNDTHLDVLKSIDVLKKHLERWFVDNADIKDITK